MAVGRERAHAQLLGQGEGLAVVALGLLDVGRVGVRGDLAQQAERPGLAATLLVLAASASAPPGQRAGVRQPTGEQVAPRPAT